MIPKEFLLTFPDIEEAVSNGYDIRLSEHELIDVMRMYSAIQIAEAKNAALSEAIGRLNDYSLWTPKEVFTRTEVIEILEELKIKE